MESTHLPALRIAPFQLLQRYPSVPNGKITAILLALTYRASGAGSSLAYMILGVAMLVVTLLATCLSWFAKWEPQGFFVDRPKEECTKKHYGGRDKQARIP